MKLIIMHSYSAYRHFLPLRSAPCSQAPSIYVFSLSVRDKVSHPYKTIGKINFYVSVVETGRQNILN